MSDSFIIGYIWASIILRLLSFVFRAFCTVISLAFQLIVRLVLFIADCIRKR